MLLPSILREYRTSLEVAQGCRGFGGRPAGFLSRGPKAAGPRKKRVALRYILPEFLSYVAPES